MSIESTMDTMYLYSVIKQKYKKYNVQGVLVTEPKYFITQKQLHIFSFIIKDVNDDKIECLAFNEAAIKFNNIELSINKVYVVKHAKAISNDKYQRTNHPMNLLLSLETQIKSSKVQEYLKNQKIFVKVNKKINKKCSSKQKKQQVVKSNQLSIKNWLHAS